MSQTTYHPILGRDIDAGAITYKKTVVSKTSSYTLTAADSGKVFLANGAATVVFTLPPTAVGLEFTVSVGTLPTGVGTSLSPNASDMITGNGFTPADDKDAINTAASDRLGDMITVVGDGVAGWIITAVNGTWAREA